MALADNRLLSQFAELQARLQAVEGHVFRMVENEGFVAPHGMSHARGLGDDVPVGIFDGAAGAMANRQPGLYFPSSDFTVTEDTANEWHKVTTVAKVDPTPFMISPASRLSIGTELAGLIASLFADFAWQTANMAVYVPFVVAETVTVVKMWVLNGATVSGNVDVGIYNAAGTKQVSMGSTAMAGANLIQEFDVADTALTAGQYYMAMAVDNVTASFIAWGISPNVIGMTKSLGIASQLTAFPLPSPGTLVVASQTRIPYCGLSLRTLVA